MNVCVLRETYAAVVAAAEATAENSDDDADSNGVDGCGAMT